MTFPGGDVTIPTATSCANYWSHNAHLNPAGIIPGYSFSEAFTLENSIRSIRESGIECVGDIPWGTHLCQFYWNSKDLVDLLVPYLRTGLGNNEYCVWITSESLTVEEARQALLSAVPDLEGYHARKQFEIHAHHDWYTRGGLDAQRLLRSLSDKADEALARGFDGFRITGDLAWLRRKDWRSFLEYEAAVQNVIGNYKILALCTYCLEKCTAGDIIDVMRSHQAALMKEPGSWIVVENAIYRQARAELQKSERYQRLVENLHEGIWLMDAEGKIIIANPAIAGMLGCSIEEMHDKSVFDFAGRPEAEALKHMLESNAKGLKAQLELELTCKHGEVITTRVLFSPVTDDSGIYDGTLAAVQDITERKQAEETLSRVMNELEHGVKERTAELRELSRRLVEAQEKERRAVARELHDQIGQALTALKMLLNRAISSSSDPLLGEAVQIVEDLMKQTRNLALDLRPAMLDDLGLLPTLLWHFERYTRHTNVRVDFKQGGFPRDLSPEITTAAYRIVQEALTNAARHAGVTAVSVRLWVEDNVLHVHIADRGKGFEPVSAPSSGLDGMRERARLLGGRLLIKSVPNAGTLVKAEIPLGKARNQLTPPGRPAARTAGRARSFRSK